MIADMHCDTLYELDKQEKAGVKASLLHNDLMLDLEKMKQSDYLIQNFAIFTDLKNDLDPLKHVADLTAIYQRELTRHQQLIAPVRCYQDIMANRARGLMSAMLTIEEGAVIDDDLSYLERYYDQGVRMITISWNYPNGLSYPNVMSGKDVYQAYNTQQGLTDFGKAYVRKMMELGMIIDVSHMSDAGFYDVLSLTNQPFVASHSNARSICPHARNLSDEMILLLAQRGGVMGLNYYAPFLRKGASRAEIADMVRHILYIRQLAGIDVIGLGSDFDGIDCPLEMRDAAGMPMLAQALREAGLTSEEIDRIFYQNVLRVYQSVLG